MVPLVAGIFIFANSFLALWPSGPVKPVMLSIFLGNSQQTACNYATENIIELLILENISKVIESNH